MRVYKDDIVYIESFWSGRKRVFYKNIECFKNENGNYEYINEEEKKEIIVDGSMLKGVNIKIDDKKIEVVEKIKWYEYLLCFSFLGIIFYDTGIIIGSLIASLFGMIDLILMRSMKNILLKILVSIITLALAFGTLYLALLILKTISKQE